MSPGHIPTPLLFPARRRRSPVGLTWALGATGFVALPPAASEKFLEG